MAKKNKGNSYTVQAGDSWAKIAGKLYGNQRMFKELMAANPQLKYLRPGQSINLAMPKRNEDIVISNAAATAMGMATSNEVADFYGQNANAQKYGMTNMLRDAAAGTGWNTNTQTTAAGNAQYQASQAAANEQARMAGGMQDAQTQANMRANLAKMKRGFQGANPYQDERYAATAQSNRRPFSAADDTKVPRMPARPDRPVKNVDRPDTGGFWNAVERKINRATGGFQLPSLPNFGGMPSTAQSGPFQVDMGPLGPSVGLSPQGMAGVTQAVGAANVAMGGQPPAGATVTNGAQPTQQPQQGPPAPVDPVKQAVTNIESGAATDRDYAVVSATKLQSGQMTAQDWQYLAKVMNPDQVREAQSDYYQTFGGGAAAPGMDIMLGGIGNPSGVSSMVGNVFVGPNFDANKLRGYTNANGTFVAANLAGSYFAPLKPQELMGYRSQRRATQLQESGGYPGSGLSTGLYTWRL